MNSVTEVSGGEDLRASRTFAWLVRWGLYPSLWLWTLVCIGYAISHPDSMQEVQMIKGGVMIVVLLFCEWILPYRRRWGMTWRYLLKRDLVFIVFNGATIALLSTALVMVAVVVSEYTEGPMSGKPLFLQVVVGLIVFEALQYGVHRIMHMSRGPITNVLWRAHSIHHLPQQLYVVMHAVFHPINAIVVRLFVQLLPLWALGFDPLAVLAYGSVIALHGTISHFNVDLRMGWLNYLFVGPELHRYHHSAKSHEAHNYGAALSLFDLLFNTFLYRPGVPPQVLGLKRENGYPEQVAPLTALLFPLSVSAVSADMVEQSGDVAA
ncbi:MAG: sterol desaturase family protein [Gammaproteobacteria bacterium]|nr:sterol desaturase family protein [Gammaproteobacteria bacterium]